MIGDDREYREGLEATKFPSVFAIVLSLESNFMTLYLLGKV